MNKKTSRSLEETAHIARDWLASLEKEKVREKIKEGNGTVSDPGDGATVIGLSGNLGSGKTAFVQAVAAELGITEHVTSPTYVIEKIYKTKNDKFPRLIHIDAYRLESARELEVLNFEELVEDSDNLILIEWPENVKEILPEGTKIIRCKFMNENEREYGFLDTIDT
jgi:tRNA threonylcarbamoyl adenosine modification protein YjeE